VRSSIWESLRLTKFGAAIALSTLVIPVHSGQHQVEVDEFSGSKFPYFGFTRAEESAAGFQMWLSGFDATDNTIRLNTSVNLKVVSCGELGLDVKSKDGKIEKFSATETRLSLCRITVPVELLKDRFSVRVPLHNGSQLIGTMDTRSLKPERYSGN